MNIFQTLPLSLLFLFTFFLTFPFSHPKPNSPFENTRLKRAYKALQAWKNTMTEDPTHFTGNWVGYDVCSYNGVFCAPFLHQGNEKTVAGIDLKNANIKGSLPSELGLLTDLAFFHLNSNRFGGPIPETLIHWCVLYELDISNNNFNGGFPEVFLSLPSLKLIDIRYNYFNGPVPSRLFDLDLDAIFINNNNFASTFPQNIGNSPVSVAVLAHNKLPGYLPHTVSKMSKTLNEIILEDTGLKGPLPSEIGELTQLVVLDVSHNELSGSLPDSIGNLKNLEQLNVGFNKLLGTIPESLCELPKLKNFTFSPNLFDKEPPECIKWNNTDDCFNCIHGRLY